MQHVQLMSNGAGRDQAIDAGPDRQSLAARHPIEIDRFHEPLLTDR
jgi:hypothetical protein